MDDEDPTGFRIGDFVVWRGRLHVLRGIDPMSVEDRHVDLEECGSGERRRPPLAEIAHELSGGR
jgi:hypothetical protein